MKLRLKELERFVPADVLEIVRTLKGAGHQACLVGGCVRDLILGRSPLDWDIATSAVPDLVQSLFSETVATGKLYGTIGVPGTLRSRATREETLLGIEKNVRPLHQVTTFRKEGAYSDHRRPDTLVFTHQLNEDLARRDFTFNAIAYNPIEREIVDIFGGVEDLKFQTIRAVGVARDRFLEDTLRPFRALRFVAQLGFTLLPETTAAIADLAPGMPLPAPERIGAEWDKLIKGDHFLEALRGLQATGLWDRLFPTWPVAQAGAGLQAAQERLLALPRELRLAALFFERPDVEALLRQLAYGKKDIQWTLKLIENGLDPQKAALDVHALNIKAAELIELGLHGEDIGRMQRALLAYVKQFPSKNKRVLLLEESKRLLALQDY